jgi:exonuclease SbcC
MRPLRLKVENFTCFNNGPVEVDFTSLELFAITGRTGAGKSSILDAMIFALYGSVPRIGAKGLSELISLGRERMAVVFDFSVGLRSFRATRIVRRTGPSQARLDELTGGQPRPVMSGVRETGSEIARLLGVPYDTFIQAVVLPQGQFATFLKSAPGERRGILRELLRLQVYETMRNLVSRRRDDLDIQLKLMERQLAEDFASVTPEALEALRCEEKELAGQIHQITDELATAERKLAQLRSRREKTQELEHRRTLVADLAVQEPRIKVLTARIEQARRAAPLQPLIEAASSAASWCKKAENAARTARDKRDFLNAGERKLRTELQRTRRKAKALPELRKRIAELDQVLGRLKSRDALRNRLSQTKGRGRRLKSELDDAKARERRAGETVRRSGIVLAKATRQLDGVRYDAELDRKLDAVRNRATLIAALRDGVAAKAEDAQQAGQRVEHCRAVVERANAAAQRAQKRLERVCERTTELQSALEQARRSHATAILRRQLRPGMPCPVCEGSVAELPAPLELPDLCQLEERFAKAREDEAHARAAAREKGEAAAGAQTAAQEADRAARRIGRQLEQARANLVKVERELEADVGGLVANESGATIERRILNATRRVAGQKSSHDCAARMRELAQKKFDDASRAFDQASAETKRVADLLAQVGVEVDGLKAETSQVNSEIVEITAARDPKAERERLAAICSDLDRALANVTQAHANTAKALSAAAATIAQAARAAAQAALDVKRTDGKAHQAAKNAGFADVTLAAKAVLSNAEIARAERRASTWQRETELNARRVAELAGQLVEGGVSAETLGTQERVFNERKGAYDRATGERARRQEQIRQLALRLERARSLRRKLESCRRSHGLYAQLADDLRSDRFQAFLLRDIFRDLVRGASQRLWELSARYRLHWEDENFHVVDYDNGRQPRPADTLSGGETFMTALALALELSEQIQLVSGAVKLSSLFIDEGFGTLDPESLDAAAGAIENLPTAGRMVGIITHIEEFSERLPACIRVEKRASGSHIQVEVN